jgi:geranylgeranyl pyrophosphate synthase
LKKAKVSNSDIKTAISLIKKTNSYQKSLQKGREFVEKAKKELEFLPKNKWNAFLKLFANFIIEREK